MYIGDNIKRLRKQANLTQQQLADRLKISFQAISKWENNKSMPDISLLNELAQILNTDIDALMGYVPNKRQIVDFQKKYKEDKSYWGMSPDKLCLEVLKLKIDNRGTLIDIGCGQGRNSIFFAKNGFNVVAVDISSNGIENTKQTAKLNNLDINAFTANIFDFSLENDFDVIFCIGTLNYIPQQYRYSIIKNYIEHLSNEGVIALNVIVDKPFLPKNKSEFFNIWQAGELTTYLQELEIITNTEIYENDICTNTIIAKRRKR